MKALPAIVLCLVGIVAIAGITVSTSTRHGESVLASSIDDLECLEVEPSPVDEDVEAMAPAGPTRIGRQYRVNCSSMDGGAAVSLLVPMDGGTTGKLVDADR